MAAVFARALQTGHLRTVYLRREFRPLKGLSAKVRIRNLEMDLIHRPSGEMASRLTTKLSNATPRRPGRGVDSPHCFDSIRRLQVRPLPWSLSLALSVFFHSCFSHALGRSTTLAILERWQFSTDPFQADCHDGENRICDLHYRSAAFSGASAWRQVKRPYGCGT